MPVRIDGHSFRDKEEGDRYLELKRMVTDGEISKFTVVERSCKLVKGYHKCETCGAISDTTGCDTCGSKTYFSTGIQYHPSFIVYENDGKVVLEDVMRSLNMSHVWNLKKILYDLTYTAPLYVIVRGKRYRKTSMGWVVVV